jgi:carbon-monoxide dehydrogenase medium subunit
MTTLASIIRSSEVEVTRPILSEVAATVADVQVRNRGTLGGSLANNDPAADWPAAVLGLDATVVTNKRKIGAGEFFKGMYETALAADEIITAVLFPVPKKAAYVKFPNPASRFALVGVFVAQLADDSVRVAVTGAASSVFRATPLENALARHFSPAAAKGVTIDASGLNNDLHGSAEYRAHLIPVLAARAVAAA